MNPECRLCQSPEAHVHPTEHLVARLKQFKRPPRALKLAGITNLDWGIPAVRYNGQWYEVPKGFLEKVWPRVRERIMRSAARPVPESEESHEQNTEPD